MERGEGIVDSGCRGEGILLNGLALLSVASILNPDLLRVLGVSVVNSEHHSWVRKHPRYALVRF